ncbi:MAG: hypothetical protein WCO55_00540 [Candidatus Falkowbacteria bacterium]
MKRLFIFACILALAAAVAQAKIYTVTGPTASYPSVPPVTATDMTNFLETKPSVAAPTKDIEIIISSAADSHGGDTMSFSYTLTNKAKTAKSIAWSPDISCPGMPKSFLPLEQAVLDPQQKIVKTFTGAALSTEIASQNCLAFVRLVQPYVTEASRTIKIVGLSKLKIGVELAGNQTCATRPAAFLANSSCVNDKKHIFTKDSQILINPTSNSGRWEALNYTATLVNPNGLEKPIPLPYVLAPDQAGIWTIEVAAGLKGYTSNAVSLSFAVVYSLPVIQAVTLSGVNSGLTNFNDQNANY